VSRFKWIGGYGPDPQGGQTSYQKKIIEEISSCFLKDWRLLLDLVHYFYISKKRDITFVDPKLLLMGEFLRGSETVHIITAFGKTFIT
jgi:hypothetical protein